MQFDTVFDAAQAGYNVWSLFVVCGLLAVAVGGLMVFAPDFMKHLSPIVQGKAGGIFCLAFAIFLNVALLASTYIEYASIRHALRTGEYQTVEGVVMDFVPMPPNGHAMESFRVGGVPFQYSDYDITSAFNKTESHGGPIHAGRYVRIAYLDNKIIKLEVARNPQ